ncbi:cysteine hydrolase, partial [Roseomonas sp. DSM 102946]|nr:cysteine hydrolase [Roseomonas sp. DSM 102946]
MEQTGITQAQDGLRFGPLGGHCLHLCVDMQNLFSQGSPWETPWMERVLPAVEALAERHAERTVFTRFIPLRSPREGRGTWRRYYERWPEMRLDALPPEAIDLLPPLARFVPPAEVLDKTVYSPWSGTELEERLRARDVDTLVITGVETDVCVLAAVLGA